MPHEKRFPIGKVSIIIPVFNGSNYMREAIDSALGQTYENREIIVVNDGSTDQGETEGIALSYGNRIRYILKKNGGVASALNAGIRNMTGNYFSWLSHDDVYYPYKVEAQMKALSGAGQDSILYSDYEFIDRGGRTVGTRTIRPAAYTGFRLSLIVDDPVNGCAALIPRSCFDACGLFDEGLRTIQDYDMWFRLARTYRFIHLPQVLIRSRKHEAQGSHTISTHFAECDNTYAWFIRELTDHEIDAMSSAPRSISYLLLALRVKLRGYTSAADVALELSDRHAHGLPPLFAVRRLALRALYKALNKKCKPSYWLSRFQLKGKPRT